MSQLAGRMPCETPEAFAADAAAGDTRWILPATILGSSLSFIDGSVVNVALPAMQHSLRSDFSTMQWVVNGYLLMLASLILLGGAAGDRFGKRRIFMVGLLGFAVASFACAVAPGIGWLIAARIAEGAAAALLVPASLAIIGSAYSGDARGPAIGTWAAAAAVTTALGPPLGGWLVDAVSWRAIFLINLPVAALALLFAFGIPADRHSEATGALDLRGAGLGVLVLGAVSYGLIALGQGCDVAGAIAFAIAIPAVWFFVRTEQRADAPMLPLALFSNRAFAGANGMTVLLYAALTGALFLLPFLLIRAYGFSATAAGAALLPFSVIMGAGSRAAGGLVERIGARLPLIAGPGVTACGYALLGFSAGDRDYWSGFLPGLVLAATGMTVAVAPLTTVVFGSAPAYDSGIASGINNAAARTGGLLAVAALGLAFGGSGVSPGHAAALVSAYRLTMYVAAVLSVLSGLAAARSIAGR